jgi:hypothetical protein
MLPCGLRVVQRGRVSANKERKFMLTGFVANYNVQPGSEVAIDGRARPQ